MAVVNRQQLLDKAMDPQNSVRGSLKVSVSVEVIEGPAGVLFARGSTGGGVNYVSKTPHQAPRTEIDTTPSASNGTKRVTLDFDPPKQIGPGFLDVSHDRVW